MESREAILQASIDSLLTELHLARERIADLECDVTTYRMLAAAGLDCISGLTKRNKQLSSRIDTMNQTLRQLMGCTEQAPATRAREEAERTIADMRRQLAQRPVKATEPSWTM
jgi:hypothetical protein